jgi:hypothetical protein
VNHEPVFVHSWACTNCMAAETFTEALDSQTMMSGAMILNKIEKAQTVLN